MGAKGFNWQSFSFVLLLLSIVLLFGIWYVNNEKAFLVVENNKLKMEIKTLEEEIEFLQGEVTTLSNQIRDAGDENTVEETQPEPTPGDNAGASQETSGENSTGDETNNENSVYEVKPGDTLTGISISLFGTESYASQIAELNGLTPESILQVGQTLKIPRRSE